MHQSQQPSYLSITESPACRMKKVLPVIILSQFLCTSLWFAGNAILPDIVKRLQLDAGFIASMTSFIQLGFIGGTLVFSLFTIADRFSPSLVFFISAVLAALSNLGIVTEGIQPGGLLLLRFLTGFFLAGIYPVGMKIASDYYKEGLGKSLGFLVGALVLGTAFPHLLKSFTISLPWKYVGYTTSLLAVTGGLIIWRFVPDGPYRKQLQKVKITAFAAAFKNAGFRAAAFGYFGHMWELYAFWTFVPVILETYRQHVPSAHFNTPLVSFFVIGSGSLSCIAGGVLSARFGLKKIAASALALSGCCCLLSPYFLSQPNQWLLFAFLFCWGLAVVADSPLFSTMVAQHAPEKSRGTALTITTCIGFLITIISIQLISRFYTPQNASRLFLLLAIGPALGLYGLFGRKKEKTISRE